MTRSMCLLVILTGAAVTCGGSDFAVRVVDYAGSFGPFPYDDPQAVLGKPALQCINDDPLTPDPTFRVKLIEGAYNLDLQQQRTVTTINPGAYIVVRFDHKVFDFPKNPYDQDFIVFGNAPFKVQLQAGQGIGDAVNLNTLRLTDPAQVGFEEVWVSVSQDGQTWYRFENGPWADDLYPTQAYKWDRQNVQWTETEMDFTRPVDPNLSLADFSGLSVADAIDRYAGSAGGTPFDLRDLPDYTALIPDPNTGLRWIEYVRLEGGEGIFALGGEVDAVADVAVCGDPAHPYPPGDSNRDCRVDLADLAILSDNWLQCTYHCEQ